MRCLVPFAAALVCAAGFTEMPVEEAMTAPGFVVVELAGAAACPDLVERGWKDPAVEAVTDALGATIVTAPRTSANLSAVLGDGFKAAVVRVAFRDGEEIDRLCGCDTPVQLATWLGVTSAGGNGADALRAELDARDTLDVGEELRLVQLLHCAHRLDDAFAALVSLWDRIPAEAPEQRGLRLTRVAHDMGVLARSHPPAEKQLEVFRDALEGAKDKDARSLDEWVALNRILLDDERTTTWYDAAIVSEDPTLVEMAEYQQPNIFLLQVEFGDWAKAGTIIGDPVAWVERWKKVPGSAEAVRQSYAALLAAGRHGDAAKLGKLALDMRQDLACPMVQESVSVGSVHKSQKGVVKRCDDEAVLAAWTAALSAAP